MKVEIEDLRRVVERRNEVGGKVVLGGHSLGGSITTAYATWDFNGKPGAEDLSGLVFIDGGSSPTPVTRRGRPSRCRRSSAIAVAHVRRHPRAVRRVFNATGSTGRVLDPN